MFIHDVLFACAFRICCSLIDNTASEVVVSVQDSSLSLVDDLIMADDAVVTWLLEQRSHLDGLLALFGKHRLEHAKSCAYSVTFYQKKELWGFTFP